jgi:predicted porin
MKKLVIASAVAAALASGSVFAENTVYGKVGLSIDLATKTTGDVKSKSVSNVSSRFGFKGKEDLGNGMSSFYRYEAGTSDEQGDATGTRLLYAGLEGDFGQVGVGSQWTPTYTLVRSAHDPFNSIGGNLAGGNFAAGFRTSDAIWYLNSFGDVTFAAALVADEASDKINDATDVAVSVPVGPVTIGVAFQQTDAERTYSDGNTGDSQSAVNIGYKADDLSVNLGVFMTDMEDDWTVVTASYMGFTAQFEDNGTDNQTSLGYTHKMGKQTSVFVETTAGDIASDETNVGIVVTF